MAANHPIKFYMIAELFKDDEKQLRRGENSYESGHVKKMIFDSAIHPAVLKGEVHASMKNRFYTVEVSLDMKKNGIVARNCSCPRGLDLCHHMAALLYYAHYNISSTDKEKAWGTPSKSSKEEECIQTIEELFPHKEQYLPSIQHDQLNVSRFKEMLGETNVVGYSWLLKPEADDASVALIITIEDVIFSEEYLNADDKKTYLSTKCSVSPEEILTIASATIGQHKNECWLIARKTRITASKFGLVLNACKRNKFPPSLFKSLVEGYNLDRALAVQWGRNNENTALQKFSEVTGLEVTGTGLWLHESGFLGASPDGLIGEDAIIEIKCPYRMRNTPIKESVNSKKYFFHYEEDNVVVDSDHVYYHQIQGQLHITNRKKCYFFVWTPNDCVVLLIEKDPQWTENLTVLIDFFMNTFIPSITKK